MPDAAPPPAAPAGRRLVSDTGKLSVANAAAHFLGVFSGLVLAGILSPAVYGVWRTVQLAVDLSSFANLGTINGVDRTCPALATQGRVERYRDLAASSLGFTLAGAAIIAVGAIVAIPFLPGTTERVGAAGFALLLGVLPFFTHGESAVNVERRFGLRAVVVVVQAVVRLVVGTVAALFFGLVGVIATFWVSTLWGAWYMVRRTQIAGMPSLHREDVRFLVGQGLPVTILGLGERLLLNADRIVVVAVLGAEAMGHYQLALFAMPVLLLVPTALRQVVQMDVYDKTGRGGDLSEVETVFARSIEAIALSSPLMMGAVYFGVPMLIELFLRDYIPAIPATKLFAVLCYPILPMQTAFVMIVVARRVRAAAGAMLAATAICAVAAVFVARNDGTIASVLGVFACGWTATCAGMLFAAQRFASVAPLRAATRTLLWLLPMAFVAVAMPLAEWAVRAAGLEPRSISGAVLGGVVHLAFCAPLLWALERRTKAPSHLLGAMLRRFRKP